MDAEELTVSRQRGQLSWIGGLFLFDEADRQPTAITLEVPRLENLSTRVSAPIRWACSARSRST